MKSAKTFTAARKACNGLGARPVVDVATAVGETSHLFLNLALFCVLLVNIAGSLQAQTTEVLYSFTGGADGGAPGASLIQDAMGNFYAQLIPAAPKAMARCLW